jgi:hypothetical protein
MFSPCRLLDCRIGRGGSIGERDFQTQSQGQGIEKLAEIKMNKISVNLLA